MMRHPHSAALFGLLVLVAACSDPAPPLDADSSATAEEPSVVVPDTASVNEAEAEATDTEADVTIGDVSVALDEAGLRFVDGAQGSASPLAFGAPFAQATDAVTRAQGEPTDTMTLPECPAGPLDTATWANGLTVYGAEGSFVGWAVNGSDATASTMAGVGVGSSRAEVEDIYEIEVMETSLGTEFSTGGIAGIFSGPGPDATVTNLWAGTSCNFR